VQRLRLATLEQSPPCGFGGKAAGVETVFWRRVQLRLANKSIGSDFFAAAFSNP